MNAQNKDKGIENKQINRKWLTSIVGKIESGFRILWSTVSGFFKRDKISTWGRFPEGSFLDPEEIARFLRAEDRGAENGKNLLPASEAEEYDDFHRQLKKVFNERFMAASRTRMAVLSYKEKELNSYELSNPVQEMENAVRKADTGSEKVFDKYKVSLNDLYRRSSKADREYLHFQRVNQRREEPRLTHHFAWPLSIVFAMVALEGLFNGAWLSDATDFGTVGGAFLAMLVSGLNVTTSAIAGFVLGRGINLIDNVGQTDGKKIPFWHRKSFWCCIGVLVYLVFIVLLHWTFAGFRYLAVTTGDMSTISSQVVPEMTSNFFFWTRNLESWFLFIIGIFFAGIAFWEGCFAFSDPYPGYTAISKRKKAANEGYVTERNSLFEEVEKIFEVAQNTISTALELRKKELNQFQFSMREYESLVMHHNEELFRIESVLNSVAKKYREANIRHRGTSDAPTYFQIPMPFEPIPIEPDPMSFCDPMVVRNQFDHYTRKLQEFEGKSQEMIGVLIIKLREKREKLYKDLKELEGKVKANISVPADIPSKAEFQRP